MTDPKLTVAEQTGVLNIPYAIYSPPIYICPKHGEVNSFIDVYADWPEKGKYCQRCWAEWLASNIPKVTTK